MGLPFVHIKLILMKFIILWINTQPCKQTASIQSARITQFISKHHTQNSEHVQYKMCEWHKFQSTETKKKREVSYPQCGWRRLSELFLVVSLVAGSQRFWRRISQSCHCVFRRGRGGKEIVWTGSKRCENGGAGIFTPRVCTGGLNATFLCHPFDSIISWRFWRLPLISWAGAAFNTALSL